MSCWKDIFVCFSLSFWFTLLGFPLLNFALLFIWVDFGLVSIWPRSNQCLFGSGFVFLRFLFGSFGLGSNSVLVRFQFCPSSLSCSAPVRFRACLILWFSFHSSSVLVWLFFESYSLLVQFHCGFGLFQFGSLTSVPVPVRFLLQFGSGPVPRRFWFGCSSVLVRFFCSGWFQLSSGSSSDLVQFHFGSGSVAIRFWFRSSSSVLIQVRF